MTKTSAPAGDSVSDADAARIVSPLPSPAYTADLFAGKLRESLESLAAGYGGLNLDPEFQRGRVWTEAQQVAFVESLVRGAIPKGGIIIQFNAPHWDNHGYKGDLPRELQIVDGLQRLTALQRAADGELALFGMPPDWLERTRFGPKRRRTSVVIAVHAFQSKVELLDYYLSINSGGTPHSPEELARVASLRDQALGL